VVPTSLGGRLLSLYRHHFGTFVHAACAIVHSHPTGISIVCFIGCSKWSPVNSQPPGRQPATALVEVIRLIVAVPAWLLGQNPATRITRKWSRLSSSFGPSIVLD
jgi:hypothetical protein